MKVLIADQLPEKRIQDLKDLGLEVIYNPDITADSLSDNIKGVNIIIVRSTKVLADTINNADELSLIVRSGAGVNNIDLDAASEKGIFVANCPGKNSAAVAELVMGLIISIDRKIPDNVIQLRQNKWNKKEFSKASGIKGKTLGVIGCGRIGQEVIKRAKGFDMKIIGWSRSLTPEKAEELEIEYIDNIQELVKRADIITLHVAMVPETKHMINKEIFDIMKPGTIFINTSRSGVIDQCALKEAIEQKGIRAGLDVVENEPKQKCTDFECDIKDMVYATHHIGASTEQAQDDTAGEAVRVIKNYIKTGQVINCVNIAEKTSAKYQLTVTHYDKIGVLAKVLSLLRKNDINIDVMHNTIFNGEKAAFAEIKINKKPDDDILNQLRNDKDDIISVKLIELL